MSQFYTYLVRFYDPYGEFHSYRVRAADPDEALALILAEAKSVSPWVRMPLAHTETVVVIRPI